MRTKGESKCGNKLSPLSLVREGKMRPSFSRLQARFCLLFAYALIQPSPFWTVEQEAEPASDACELIGDNRAYQA